MKYFGLLALAITTGVLFSCTEITSSPVDDSLVILTQPSDQVAFIDSSATF